MCEANQTKVLQIYLLGFRGLNRFKPLFFIVFLLSYIVILGGNILIITVVSVVDHLKIPMFIFLKHLAVADILMTTTIVPMMLNIILVQEGTVSFFWCITQLYCFGIFAGVQCFLIAVMSYDRYLAICKPLHYASLINPHISLQLIIGLWFLSIFLLSVELTLMCLLNFCGLNYIDHFFCDFGPLIELSTSNKLTSMMLDLISSIFMVSLPFAFIVMTYIYIFLTILKMSSANGRKKAFSTCSSHLALVCTSYGTLITVYIVPTDYSEVNINKYKSLLYIVVAPMMNPIIYSLRNLEIQRAVHKLLNNVKMAKTDV
ncbi:olfactory receptor 10A7-like [Hyperolius riggenbachi]|uniref:olfactory receptor 10A7-like n=1 Tax=Hyperolius riggenbachi TaxID=752182 RepID=UPI0035A346AA